MERVSDDADPGVVRRTQFVDIARSVPLGVILPLEMSVFLTIAIQHFQASSLAKGLIASSTGIGMLLSSLLTARARRSSRPAMAIASTVIGLGGIGFAVASTGSEILFVAGVVVGLAAISLNTPLLTATYEQNFSPLDRGKRVGRGLVLKVAVSAPLSILMGAWLRDHLEYWWVLALVAAAAAGLLSALNRLFPSEPLSVIADARQHPWPRFELLRLDRRLRVVLVGWMFMGFANLMLLPLRIEYLAQPEYGIEATAVRITVLTVAVPSVLRLLTTPVFGRIFDRASFFTMRIGINVLFMIYVVAFFSGTTSLGLWIGAIMLGVAFAGGDLLWVLWVTKFAPPGRVADYMGLHTFFTGIRAVSAPLFAFLVIERISLGWVAVFGVGLIVASSIVLLPEAIVDERARRSGSSLPA